MAASISDFFIPAFRAWCRAVLNISWNSVGEGIGNLIQDDRIALADDDELHTGLKPQTPDGLLRE